MLNEFKARSNGGTKLTPVTIKETSGGSAITIDSQTSLKGKCLMTIVSYNM